MDKLQKKISHLGPNFDYVGCFKELYDAIYMNEYENMLINDDYHCLPEEAFTWVAQWYNNVKAVLDKPDKCSWRDKQQFLLEIEAINDSVINSYKQGTYRYLDHFAKRPKQTAKMMNMIYQQAYNIRYVLKRRLNAYKHLDLAKAFAHTPVVMGPTDAAIDPALLPDGGSPDERSIKENAKKIKHLTAKLDEKTFNDLFDKDDKTDVNLADKQAQKSIKKPAKADKSKLDNPNKKGE